MRFGHDPAPHVSARLNSALLSTAPNVSAPPAPPGGAETFGYVLNGVTPIEL